MSTKSRIEWIDVAKAIGMFAIYLCHMGTEAGALYKCAWAFVVSFFFFLSGMLENVRDEEHIRKRFINLLRNIFVPFICFGILSILIANLAMGTSYEETKQMVWQLFGGAIRNNFIAPALWFLTCHIVVCLLFGLIKRKVKNKSLILIISLLIHLSTQWIFIKNPIREPAMLFNVDSACYYLFFYALGYCVYNGIESLFSDFNIGKYFIITILTIVSVIYCGLYYFETDLLGAVWEYHEKMIVMRELIRPMFFFWLMIIIAHILSGVKVMRRCGELSLYLCGNEYIIKILLPSLFSMFGLSFSASGMLQCFFSTVIMFALVIVFLVPVEQQIISRVNQISGSIFHMKSGNKKEGF